ncbi:MAG: hypothetical protein ACM3U1_09415 [Chloroflexota bacterium]
MKNLLRSLIVLSAAVLAGCASQKLPFEQTCMTCVRSQRLGCVGDECPSTFMIGGNAVVTMIETGENIYLNPILLKENIAPKQGIPVAIAKIRGIYFLIAENFSHLYMITDPEGAESKFEEFELPNKMKSITAPVFEITGSKLMLSASNLNGKWVFYDDDEEWKPFGQETPKKGD